MTCSCNQASTHSETEFSPEQEQYLTDLLNSQAPRTDGAVPACKGNSKLCKGRCIPKDHQCREGGKMGSSHQAKSGLGGAVAKGLLTAGAIGAAGIGTAAVLNPKGTVHVAEEAINGAKHVGKEIAKSGLNTAEKAINGTEHVVQKGIGGTVEGVTKAAISASNTAYKANNSVIQGSMNSAIGVHNAAAKAATSASNTAFKTANAVSNASDKTANAVHEGAGKTVMGALEHGIKASINTTKTANKGRAYVRALRSKLDK